MSFQIRHIFLLNSCVSQSFSQILNALGVRHYYSYSNNMTIIKKILILSSRIIFYWIKQKVQLKLLFKKQFSLFLFFILNSKLYNMAKMPPPSYMASNKLAQRLHFPRPGDPSLFQNSGRRHYHNNSIFSTPYALFQDDSKNYRNQTISLPESRNTIYPKKNVQESAFSKHKQHQKSYLDNDYDRLKKEKDALDQQVYNLQLNKPKQLEIQIKPPYKQKKYQEQFLRKSQVNPQQNYVVQYSTIQPKRREYYPSAQQLPSTNIKKINRERIKTEAPQMPQQSQHRNSALNRYARFNPTYLSWIN